METKTVTELRAMCKEAGIKNYSGKKRSDLLLMLADAGVVIEEEEPVAGAADDALSPDASSRDERMKFYEDIHNLLWNRAGLDPRDSFDHMTFFFALYKLEEYIARDETFGPNCRWSRIVENIEHPSRLHDMLFGDSADSAINVLATHRQTAPMFDGFICKIPKADLVMEVVEVIHNFPYDDSNDTLGELYEYMIGRGGETMSDRGAYFTTRAICRAAFNLALGIKGGSVLRADGSLCTVFDPFCGTGGFLSEYIRGVNAICPIARDWMQDRARIFGCDIDHTSVRIAMINMLISTGVPFSDATIRSADSFREDITMTNAEWNGDESLEKFHADHLKFPNLRALGRVDFGMANPPYGGDGKFKIHEGTGRSKRSLLSADIQSIGIEGKSKAACGMQLCMSTLAPGGVQCIVMPQGFFFQRGGIFARLKEKLFSEYRVHYVVTIPDGAFVNTGVKTGMIVFQAGVGLTENVRFVRLTGDAEHGISTEVEDICTATIDAIRANGYDLTAHIYTRKIRAGPTDMTVIEYKLRDIVKLEAGRAAVPDETVTDGYPIYGGGDKMRLMSQESNRKDAFIIARMGSAGSVRFVGGHFYLNEHGWSFSIKNPELATKTFVGCYLLRNEHVVKSAITGSVQPGISMDSFGSLPIFLPPIATQRLFTPLARLLLLEIARDKESLSLLERRLYAQIRELQYRYKETPKIPLSDLVEIVKFKGHAVSEGVDVRDDVNRYPLLRSSRDGKMKWMPTCDITERLIAMGNGGEANITLRENFNISTHFITFRATEAITLPFLYYLLKSSITHIGKMFFAGTTLENLQIPQFMAWELVVPPLEEQHAMDEDFDTAWRLKEHITRAQATLDRHIDRFIQRAVITHDGPLALLREPSEAPAAAAAAADDAQ